MHRAVLAGRPLERQSLHVIGDDHASHRPPGNGYAQCAVDNVFDLLRGDDHLHVIMRDILEQRHQIHFLLVAAAERGARLLADDGEHRLMIALGVVQTIQ